MPRALLSVSDKSGIVDLARELAARGWDLVSTGGTARALREAGLDVLDVSDVTGHAEMMDGRVKTLHPAVHAGLLARRELQEDREALERHGYTGIDLVVVNLYPFRETVAKGAALPEAIEQIDIGGPSMLRSAAKNHRHVLVVVDPADYPRVLDALQDGPDAAPAALRLELATKVFGHTTAYDAAIADYLAAHAGDHGELPGAGTSPLAAAPWPDRLELRLEKVQDLRYGENPDQPAAFYALADARTGSLPDMTQHQGKELSFNNLMDVDAAVMAVSPWAGAAEQGVVACAILKHTTPCGVAVAATSEEAYRRALATDPTSAFGGIVALNTTVDGATAEAMAEHFLEVVVAPAFEDAALERLGRKKNLRLIEIPVERARGEADYRSVRGGLLAQTRLSMEFDESEWAVVTKRSPTGQQLDDLRFAWRVVASVKSNAIVLARDGQVLGIGAGQMSRVDASRLAVMKAGDQQFELRGAALASDAFFPFRDSVDAAAAAGVAAVIQPGGSVRDEEVIAAADEHDIAMIFTGRRVFRH